MMARSELTRDDFLRLRTWSHIVWDIDGTITDPNGRLNHKAAEEITELASRGIYHSFVTGRDAAWIEEYVIQKLRDAPLFDKAVDRLFFFAEVGCIRSLIIDGEIQNTFGNEKIGEHPLCEIGNERQDKQRRGQMLAKLKGLVWDPEKLVPFGGEAIEPGWAAVYDANETGYKYDTRDPARFPVPRFDRYIWSSTKQVVRTYEKIRDRQSGYASFGTSDDAMTISKLIEQWGYSGDIALEPISTAINIVPKIGGVPLGKSWGAGQAMVNICDVQEVAVQSVVQRTVAFGDSVADLDFTKPMLSAGEKGREETIDIVYVGELEDLRRMDQHRQKLLKNIIFPIKDLRNLVDEKDKTQPRSNEAKGGPLAAEILKFLKQHNRLQPF